MAVETGITQNYYAWKKLISTYTPMVDVDGIVDENNSGLYYDSGSTSIDSSKCPFAYGYSGLRDVYLDIHKAHLQNYSFHDGLQLRPASYSDGSVWWYYNTISGASSSTSITISNPSKGNEYLITGLITNASTSKITIPRLVLLKPIGYSRNGDDKRNVIFWNYIFDTPLSIEGGQSATVTIKWTEGE